MCGRPGTTIGFERLYNPLARLDRDPFVAALTDAVSARPLNMLAIEATNRSLADMPWAMLASTQEIPLVDLDTLERRPLDAVLLDVREPDEYAAGHVPGALNLPQAELASRLDEVPRDRPIFVICQSGYRALRAAQFLAQRGFTQVANVDCGTQAWRAAGKELAGGTTADRPSRVTESEWAHAGAAVTSV